MPHGHRRAGTAAGLCALLLWPVTVSGDTLARFVDDAGRFEVLFAGSPQRSSATINTPWGDAVSHNFHAKGMSGAMLVSYWDYPAAGGSTAERLDAAVTAGVQTSGGRVRSKRPVSGNGMTGIEVIVDLTAQSALRGRFFLSERRLYYVAYVSRTDVSSDQAERFFASFKAPPTAP